MSDFIRKEILKNNVCIISLNRSPVNALSLDLLYNLNKIFNEINNDDQIRIVILKSDLNNFSAGADLKERKIMSKDDANEALDNFNKCFNSIENLNKPTICVINGYCLGGGAELALSFDIRIGTPDCLIGFPEVSIGIIPGAGGTQRLPKIVGLSNAKYWIYTAKKFNSDESLKYGFLNFISKENNSIDLALNIANDILKNAPIAVKCAKSSINNSFNKDISKGLQIERSAYKISLNSKDRDEALDAFINKRKTNWKNE